jgi:hypothetical protein
MSGVFQNIDPPHPSPPGEFVLPPQQRRGVHTRRAERGVGVNILEDARHRIALLQQQSLYGATTSIRLQEPTNLSFVSGLAKGPQKYIGKDPHLFLSSYLQ